MAGWRGRGKGRLPGQPRVPGVGGPGAGGGRPGAQPTIETPSSWVGKGGGRSSNQPSVQTGSLLGARSTASTSTSGSASTGVTSSATDVSDPEGSYVFALEIDGVEVAQFYECSGLKSTSDVYELQEGGLNDRVHKLPGQARWDNITLRYGVSNDFTLLQWRDEILSGKIGEDSRRSGAIIVKNNQMEEVRRYEFEEAWPVSWEGPSLNSDSGAVAIEAIELAHHGISVQKK